MPTAMPVVLVHPYQLKLLVPHPLCEKPVPQIFFKFLLSHFNLTGTVVPSIPFKYIEFSGKIVILLFNIFKIVN